MECKFCQSVNSDDAVYCKKCGKRLDGKRNCPSCGSVIEDDSVYCNVCGARVDGKVVCKKCGTAYEGAYCPQCGNKTQTAEVKVGQRESAAQGGAVTKVSKVLNYVSLGLVIAVAVMAIIFVCFTGVTLNMSSEMSGAVGSGDTSLGIFDYFSKEIQEVNDFFSGSNIEYTAAYKASLYMPAILGLISVIVSLVGTIAFAITGAVKSILNIVKKNGKNTTVWALLAFVFYLFGASMIMSINAASINNSLTNIVSASVSFNDATIAGIVLCTITVAGAVGCDTTVYFMREKLSAFKIVERVLAVVVTVGAVISIAMFASPVITCSSTATYSNMTIKTTTGMGLLGLLTLYISLNSYASILPAEKVNELNSIEVCVILGQLLIFIAIIAAFLLLVTVLCKDGKKSRCLSIVSSSIFLGAALVALIVTVLAGDKFLSGMTSSVEDAINGYSYKMGYAAIITAFVFAVITFAGNICRVVFGAKSKTDSEYIEVVPEGQPAEQAE